MMQVIAILLCVVIFFTSKGLIYIFQPLENHQEEMSETEEGMQEEETIIDRTNIISNTREENNVAQLQSQKGLQHSCGCPMEMTTKKRKKNASFVEGMKGRYTVIIIQGHSRFRKPLCALHLFLTFVR
jgi:hypothetical protein